MFSTTRLMHGTAAAALILLPVCGCGMSYSQESRISSHPLVADERVELAISESFDSDLRVSWAGSIVHVRGSQEQYLIQLPLDERPLTARYDLRVDAPARRAWVVSGRTGAVVMAADLRTGETWAARRGLPVWAVPDAQPAIDPPLVEASAAALDASLLSAPRAWLRREIAATQAACRYDELLAVRVAAGQPVEFLLGEGGYQAIDRLRQQPGVWHPTDKPALATWLAEVQPLLRDYERLSAAPAVSTRPAAAPADVETRDDGASDRLQAELVPLALPYAPMVTLLTQGWLVELWQADMAAADRCTGLARIWSIADRVATGRTSVDQFDADRIRRMAMRSLLALLRDGYVTRAQAAELLAGRGWAERQDLRCIAAAALDSELATELMVIDCLSRGGWRKRPARSDIEELNELYGRMLKRDELREAAGGDLARLRAARITFHERLRELLPEAGSAEASERAQAIDALALAASGAPALSRLVAATDYERLLWRFAEAEAHRRGRAWVRKVLTHVEQFADSAGERDGTDWFARPLFVGRDPFAESADLLIRQDGDRIILYSRGADGADDGGVDESDLVLVELDRRWLD
jgi:hypothetical protein